MKAIRVKLTGRRPGTAAPATQLDDSLAINSQKLGEIITSVNLKFSLVELRLSYYQTNAGPNYAAFYLSVHWKTFTDKFPA